VSATLFKERMMEVWVLEYAQKELECNQATYGMLSVGSFIVPYIGGQNATYWQ
jgi:hypothetical protein